LVKASWIQTRFKYMRASLPSRDSLRRFIPSIDVILDLAKIALN